MAIVNTQGVSCHEAANGACVLQITQPEIGACSCTNISVLTLELLTPNNTVAATKTVEPTSPPITFPITVDFTLLQGGTYHLRLTVGTNGCIEILPADIIIEEPDAIQISMTPTSTPCEGGSNGTMQVNATGEHPPFDFHLSTGETEADVNAYTFTGLAAGAYSVTVTDATGCTATSSKTVGFQFPEIQATLALEQITCPGGSDGMVTFSNLSGGGNSADYAFLGAMNNLTAGNHTVIVTNTATGCQRSFSFAITQPPPIILQTSVQDVSCPGQSDGSVSATVSGGNGDFVFLWNTGDKTPTVTGLPAGMYSIVVSDSEGCTAQHGNLLISQPDTFDFTFQTNSPVPSGSLAVVSLITSSSSIDEFEWELVAQFNIEGNQVGEQGTSQQTIEATFQLASNQTSGTVTYEVTPVYSASCKGIPKQVTVLIQPDVEVFIPEVFTPNNDGTNDSWQVILPLDASEGKVSVYNRSGGKVYEGASGLNWDATNCPDGVYFYTVHYQRNGKDVSMKGAVTVLRSTH
ncbi:MAG: gliding motility-associated C-terminal domain-containing protein [Saprospiraceae bacterium]|nr:gliding motility-associated C-terminal domain-containing protein [Saprospiraceae bacterium]